MKLILVSAMVVIIGGLRPIAATAQDTLSLELLESVAKTLNERMPMKVDSETELTRITAEPGALVYHGRFTSPDVATFPPDQLRAALQPVVTRKACTNSNTRRGFLDRGVTIRYRYSDRDGKFITSFDVTAADCELITTDR